MDDRKGFQPIQKSIASVLPFLIVMVFVLSCSVFGPAETPIPSNTPKPTETNTPQASNTPLPTNTEEPTATEKATPNKAATNRAKEQQTQAAKTEFAAAVLGEVDSKLDEVGEIMGSGSVIYLNPAPIEVESSKPNMVYYQLLDDSVQAEDFAFHTVITWDTKQKIGLVNCIIMFRVGPNIDMDRMYMMRMGRISGLPHIWFQLYRGWNYVAESPGRASNYINDEGGAENEIVLVARGTQFTAYANGHQVEVWWNAAQDEGGFGVGTWQDTGSSVCTFSDNWIWEWA
jgi:hypothetical protein